MAPPEHLDVLIVGAGISGIDAAYHLQTRCPTKTYAIVEARETLGGTWDLFRYPGIRSDSDMYTLGFPFRPWTRPAAIADGASILAYVRETAEAFGIDRKIRYQRTVVRARWSAADARWTIELRDTASDAVHTLRCGFLFLCSGYFNYDAGYTPELPGAERFRGRIVHPQQWSPDIAHADKRVIVIGSGATAVTLAPELAKRAAHVTMLQRSPTYIISVPSRDPVAEWMRPRLPARVTFELTRWKNVLLNMGFYAYCRRFPAHAKRLLIGQVKRQLRDTVDDHPASARAIDVDKHFTPSYKPWDQRLCLVPDADLFAAVRSGRVTVVTDHIATLTETGITLRSGETLDADLIVTATGLALKTFGGIEFADDRGPIDLAKTMVYKGMMFSDTPNLAFSIGYTNASWTLKCDLTSRYVCRLLAHMDQHGYTQCRPRRDPSVAEIPLLDFSSGYVQRSIDQFPRQGAALPWKLYQNYALDIVTLGHSRLDDGVMQFAR